MPLECFDVVLRLKHAEGMSLRYGVVVMAVQWKIPGDRLCNVAEL